MEAENCVVTYVEVQISCQMALLCPTEDMVHNLSTTVGTSDSLIDYFDSNPCSFREIVVLTGFIRNVSLQAHPQ